MRVEERLQRSGFRLSAAGFPLQSGRTVPLAAAPDPGTTFDTASLCTGVSERVQVRV